MGCSIIIGNFQDYGQGIQNFSKNNTIYPFVSMLVDFCLQRGVYLAVFKSLTTFGSWFMKLLLSWEQSGYWPKKNGCMKGIQGNSSLVMHPCPSVFQAYGSLVLLSCPQLPSNPLVCLDRISLAKPTSYEAARQQKLRYGHLQPGALHWSPVFYISVTMIELGNVGNSCSPKDSSDFQAQKRVRHKGTQLSCANRSGIPQF